MVFETLVLSPLNHLTRLIARVNFIKKGIVTTRDKTRNMKARVRTGEEEGKE
jgi:hypothetical protein